MLWAISLRTPAARAASTRFLVPSVRRRLFRARVCATFSGSKPPDRSVSWCTTTSGRTAATAAITAGRSNASRTTGWTPARSRSLARADDRVVPWTSYPLSSNNGRRRLPITPPAPARKMLSDIVSALPKRGRQPEGSQDGAVEQLLRQEPRQQGQLGRVLARRITRPWITVGQRPLDHLGDHFWWAAVLLGLGEGAHHAAHGLAVETDPLR